jgi:hypothetical protein
VMYSLTDSGLALLGAVLSDKMRVGV